MKYIYISRADMAGDVAQTKKCVATWRHVDMPRGSAYMFTRVYTHVCVRVCTHLCAHVYTCLRREINFPFQDKAVSL